MPAAKFLSHAELVEIHLRDAWLNLGNTSDLVVPPSPFDNFSDEDKRNPLLHLLRVLRNPDYFAFTCKHLFNIDLLPFQVVILNELWHRPFPMLIGCRGLGKSFLLGLYAILRALFHQGSKIIIVGAAFRQAKVVFEYCEQLWAGAPILQDLVGNGKGRNNRDNGPRRDIDRCELIIGESIIMALPLGDGKKIRGQRATHIIADEFASISEEIYENVIAGFAAVSASPVLNVKNIARIKILKQLGLWSDELDAEEAKNHRGNQAVLSGTAYYDFNHFAKYWKRYKAIIESRGDKHRLEEIFHGEVPGNFNWRDYSVIRVPVDLLPEGFMDAKHVARSRATVTKTNYNIEFGALFATDSDGFYRRLLVESCVVGKPASPLVIGGEEINFIASLVGSNRHKYVYGVDPASEKDNFSVVVLELHSNHRRVVYCWTTTRNSHKEALRRGLVKETDFYSFAARKLRSLMKVFPTELIAIDSQGGGIAVEEALHDHDKLQEGELPLWPTISHDPKERKDSDDKAGLHILEMVQFANANWTAAANHGMRKDFEDKFLLFPANDGALLGLAMEEDLALGRTLDTLEDNVMEIEALKEELATIIHTQTSTGRDHWDTPAVKVAGGKTGRLRKDRYSALLMANAAARTVLRTWVPPTSDAKGGFAAALAGMPKFNRGALSVGPDWFVSPMGRPVIGRAVQRRG